MTTTQFMRYERRSRRELERRRRIRDAVRAGIIIAFALLAFSIAGTMDYHDQQSELAYWAERGVSIQRW